MCVVTADVGPLSHTLFHSESDILKLQENKDNTKKVCIHLCENTNFVLLTIIRTIIKTSPASAGLSWSEGKKLKISHFKL